MVKLVLGASVKPKATTAPAIDHHIQPNQKESDTDMSTQTQTQEQTPPKLPDATTREPSKRELARDERLRVKAELTRLMDANPNVEFTYVRPYSENGEVVQNGGAVIAWVRDAQTKGKEYRERDTMLHVAISWCSYRDAFDKNIGRYLAIQEFIAGRTTRVRVNHPGEYSEQLKEIFSPCV